MPFLRTIPPDEASGTLRELYEHDRAAGGRLESVVALWSLRPDVLIAWRGLIGAISAHMDERRYLLVTMLAASRIRCSI